MSQSNARLWTAEDLSEVEFAAVAELLRRRRRLDLDQYKDRCIRRRIAKRLRLCGVTSFAEYLERLQSDAEELNTLIETIAVHVSHFFRNPDTYRVLEQRVLPELCRRARAAGRDRLIVWSAGCASGEEPYSLAMLIDEMDTLGLDVRVLATDISEAVLETARTAHFDEVRLREVPPAVLAEYFRRDGASYQLIDRVRDKVSFQRHDLIAAAAYPAADLVLCRNVLIYFTRAEQERILARFARALPQGSALVLGRAETITGSLRSCFTTEYAIERVYRRCAGEPAGEFESAPEGG
jgi:chemotaxis protein methyltransferase CheR